MEWGRGGLGLGSGRVIRGGVTRHFCGWRCWGYVVKLIVAVGCEMSVVGSGVRCRCLQVPQAKRRGRTVKKGVK